MLSTYTLTKKNPLTTKRYGIAIKKSCGATLLEMMISLFVMGVGMLGVLGMQTQAMRFNHQAYSYSQAVFLAQDILESMRANRAVAPIYQIAMGNNAGVAKACEGVNANCNAQQMRDWDIQHWRNNISQRLPGGQSSIELTGDTYSINIEFDVVKINEEEPNATTDSKRQTYTLNSGI